MRRLWILVFSLATKFVEASPIIEDFIRAERLVFCDSSSIPDLKNTPIVSWKSEENERSITLSSAVTKSKVLVEYKPMRTGWRVAVITIYDDRGRHYLQLRLSTKCKISRVRKLIYGENGKVDYIQNLNASNFAEGSIELQNPEFPKNIVRKHLSKDKLPIIALVDTGVNYLLADVKRYIATDRGGHIIGYDFWDDDDRPFDKDPRANPFFPLHHGTAVFSVLTSELEDKWVAIYRFPADELCKFEQLLGHIEKHEIRVVAMPMGSKNKSEWNCFTKKAMLMPETIFVISAGNDGLNIDQMPIYPASIDLENIIVVTSSDQFGRLAPRSNFGKLSVDLMVPAERISVVDHRGVKTFASGSSYAVPRVAALITRYVTSNPDSTLSDVKMFLKDRAIPSSDNVTKYGWIPDPSDNFGF